MKEVGIVVVTHNRIHLLKEVIAALRLQTYTDIQIVVVNNGSTDETDSWLMAQEDIVTITQENLGGAGGFFTGMKYVAEHGYKFCWVMDDDVMCSPTALEELLKAYKKKDNIGFVCSKVEGIDGCPMNVPIVDCRATSNGYPHYYDLIEEQMIKVQMATFVSVLFPCHILFELGLPYKEYFIWGDDSEYTGRVSNHHDCYMVCKSVVTHKRSIQRGLSFDTETDSVRLKNYFYMFRNTAHREFKYLGWKGKVFTIYRLMKQSLRYACKNQLPKAKIILRAIWALRKFTPNIYFPNTDKE